LTEQPSAYQPFPGTVLPRYAGIPTFMRLPHVPLDEAAGIDIGLIGVPFDGGTSNRPGARHGPRQMRDMSTMMRAVNHATMVAPYSLARCADLGDATVNPLDLMRTVAAIEHFYRAVHERGIVPLTAGGDHLITLPIFRGITTRDRPLGMVHFDAHTDTADRHFGESTIGHGTPFRRAIEEGLLDPRRTIQIGIRGSMYSPEDKKWGLEQGIRVIEIEEYFRIGPEGAIAEAQRVVGSGPAYVSFDVDGLDPVYTPGTGTPEIGGFSTAEAQQMLRGLRGLDLVGGDVVEVAPPFDPSGNTALVGVTMMWEILCLLAEAHASRKAGGQS
jgi:guanidinopropionase